jgi:hypothetical protein
MGMKKKKKNYLFLFSFEEEEEKKITYTRRKFYYNLLLCDVAHVGAIYAPICIETARSL